jgi:hypothetical protein
MRVFGEERVLRLSAAAYAFLALVSNAKSQVVPAPAPESHGILVANMDRSVKPGDDFYHFATASGSIAPKSLPTVAPLESSTP